MQPIKVGLLGIGTVGSGTFNVLKRNQEEIRRRAGRGIEIAMVADLNTERARELTGGEVEVVSDANEVVTRPEIDIVVELIGGYGIARELVLKAIENGKHVVTANKALLAVHGNEIFEAARRKGVIVAFEAAVAGGIPIIKALREGLTANRIQWIAGIINGTTNFILSEMRDKGLDFDVVLKEAQQLGYAEADPTFDIEGIDAAHKVTLMSAIAFGMPVQFDKAHVEGITNLSATDIKYAEELGYRIKLLGITRRREEGVELRVHPTLVPASRLIANVEGAMNAVLVHGRRRGRHAVLRQGRRRRADRLGRDRRPGGRDAPAYGRSGPSRAAPGVPAGRAVQRAGAADRGSHQLLLPAHARGRRDRRAGRDHAHPGRGRHQHRRDAPEGVAPGRARQTDIIILTHLTREKHVNAAIRGIESLPTVLSAVTRLRMEELN